ncbi:MAG: hypothetical protein ABR530_07235, partial [Pyrinomonadaceae bacterium]
STTRTGLLPPTGPDAGTSINRSIRSSRSVRPTNTLRPPLRRISGCGPNEGMTLTTDKIVLTRSMRVHRSEAHGRQKITLSP